MESKVGWWLDPAALAGSGRFRPIPAPPGAFPLFGGCFSLRNNPLEGCKWGWSSWTWEFGAGEDKGQGAEPAGKLSPWRIIPSTCSSGSAQPQIQGLPGLLGRFHGIIPPRSSGTGEQSECHGYETE